MAGSSVRESSWNPKKKKKRSLGNHNDPCCGLTQSRYSDARAVGLNCNPNDHSSEGYKCNILTVFVIFATKQKMDGVVIKNARKSLRAGIHKHLGGNTGNIHSYIEDMKAVYYKKM